MRFTQVLALVGSFPLISAIAVVPSYSAVAPTSISTTFSCNTAVPTLVNTDTDLANKALDALFANPPDVDSYTLSAAGPTGESSTTAYFCRYSGQVTNEPNSLPALHSSANKAITEHCGLYVEGSMYVDNMFAFGYYQSFGADVDQTCEDFI